MAETVPSEKVTKAMKKESATTLPPQVLPPPVDTSPKNRLAMMLLAFFAMPTGLARLYRGDSNGKVRFWIWVGATVTSIIPLLNILSALVLLVLTVWGLIDFFQLRNVKHDTNGAALTTSERDDKAVHYLVIAMIVVLCLTGVGIVLGILFAGFIFTMILNNGGIERNDPRPLPTSVPSFDQYRQGQYR